MYARAINTGDHKHLHTSNEPTRAWRPQGRKPLLSRRNDGLQRITEQDRPPLWEGRGRSPPSSSVRGEAPGMSPSPASTPEGTQGTLGACTASSATAGLQPRGARVSCAGCSPDRRGIRRGILCSGPGSVPPERHGHLPAHAATPSGSCTTGRSARPSPPRGRERPPPPRGLSRPLGPSC